MIIRGVAIVRVYFLRFLAVLAFLLACSLSPVTCPVASAQTEAATLTGTVSDMTGAVMVGVEVRIVSVDTNAELVTSTNGSGVYFVSGIIEFLFPSPDSRPLALRA